jgi:hypothetical protein
MFKYIIFAIALFLSAVTFMLILDVVKNTKEHNDNKDIKFVLTFITCSVFFWTWFYYLNS